MLIGFVVLEAAVYGCSQPYEEAQRADGGATTSSSGGGSSGSSGVTTSDGAADLPSETPEGQIRCATTDKTCAVGTEQCCITLTGTTGVVRSANSPSATCMAPGGPNCGILTTTGDDFMQKLPQSCARASDCGGENACCALPLGATADGGISGDRFGKTIGSLVCVPLDACLARGRILCRTKADCPPTTDCRVETDPVLSRLYGAFCL